MTRYTSNALVSIYPFTRQSEGEEIIIGRADTGVFLVLPSDAIELLDYLAEGKTIGQAQSLYEHKYGEIPDIEELLEGLEQSGFVRIPVKEELLSAPHSVQPQTIQYHFTQISPALAQQICSRTVLIGCGIVIALALIAIRFEPSIVPGWRAFLFTQNVTLMTLLLTGINIFTVFLHEMAHLIAARAVGVSSRLGLSNRLWILVAETDMTGVWGVPRHQRYLPFLAGPLLDTVSASLLLLILFAQKQQWLVMHPLALQIMQAMVLSYLLALLWQCYFFLRTDFYYVIANFFRCRSLMKDTKVFLHNQVSRMLRMSRTVDQSYIPKAEMRVIRWYAIVYVFGHIAAFCSLFFIGLPTMWNYSRLLLSTLSAGYQSNPYAFADALIICSVIFGFQGAGFWLWIRSLRHNKRR